ncbi:MAG TPA: hypothetical protein VMF31_05175 [Solirubrobacterales bacterium]|nr:hypothetical protein [Solirubrobacterales bacterium]
MLIALGGGAYAGITSLPKNSVGTAQIRPNAVGSKKIRPGAIGSRQMRTGAVGESQIKAGAVGTEQLGFPIGMSGVQINESTIVRSAFCTDGPEIKCSPPQNLVLLADSVPIDDTGNMKISGAVTVSSKGEDFPADARSGLILNVDVDGRAITPLMPTTMAAMDDATVPFEAFLAPAGTGTRSVRLIVQGMGFEWPDVEITSAVMTTTVLPDI